MDYTFEVTLNEHGGRLDKILARRLDEAIEGGFSRSKTKKLLDAGKVRLNGRTERFASTELEYDDVIEVDVDEEVVGSAKARRRFEMKDDDVLWGDEFVMVVDKPEGIPSQATRDPNRDHVAAAVRRYLRSQGVEQPYVAVHNRLDVGTSGAMVLAVDRRANRGLSEAFDQRRVEKVYRALASPADGEVSRQPGEQWTVENHLDERREGGVTRQVEVDAGGDFARTRFEVKRRGGSVYDIVARPHTGRRHQIRAHLAGEGLPIAGDERYGGVRRLAGQDVGRLMLHAQRLVLAHPVSEGTIEATSAVPEAFEQFVEGFG